MVSCKAGLRLGKSLIAVQAGVLALCAGIRIAALLINFNYTRHLTSSIPLATSSIPLYSDNDDHGAPK